MRRHELAAQEAISEREYVFDMGLALGFGIIGYIARKTGYEVRQGLPTETDCVAGHLGFEPANPSAIYLIGIT